MTLAPVIALSHGGGPLPVLGASSEESIVCSLRKRVPRILRLGTAQQPRAIALITAHWSSADGPAVSSGASPALLYDYLGFPPAAYALRYPAPGAPDVAARVAAAFASHGLRARLDTARGWDHGVFVPLLLAAPRADVPVVQVSVLRSEDADAHLRMGAALAALRADNIAIVGSGFASMHNLDAMLSMHRWPPAYRTAFRSASDAWNEALLAAATRPGRAAALARWRDLPHADVMHPPGAGEHFMPLLVCAGAADADEETRFYKDEYSGVDVYTFYWGADEVE